ncbi:hypothetical protein [Streptomyces sp. NPDC005302]|uniref:hypothetical protein n=1 Tax=Streptomyces sp. NPDC005302 TaxID=3154675 RepID=UPI0033A935C0
MFRKLTGFINHAVLRAYVALQVFATTEPVRFRAYLTSLIIAGGVLVPALANEQLAQALAGVGAVALPAAMAEYTRSKVTPA